MPLDLDRVEAEAAQFVAGGWVARNVPGLVAEVKRLRAEVEEWKMTAMAGAEVLAGRDAELRAAREVVDAAHVVFTRGVDLGHLMRAVAAYDRVASP
jgi:hypothetical protein